nr:hypothetical protein 11 [bacterium]
MNSQIQTTGPEMPEINFMPAIIEGAQEISAPEAPSPEALADALKSRYADLPEATDKASRQAVTAELTKVKSIRTAIEKRRKELKADSLQWQRSLDSEAKRLTALFQGVEDLIQSKRQAYDDQIAEEARKAEEAKRAAEEAERQRIEAERAEQERKAAELARKEAELAERERKMREAEDRKRFEAEAEQRAKEQAEKELAAQRQREAEEQARKEAEEARRLAAAPDREKLALLATKLESIEWPSVATEEAEAVLDRVSGLITEATCSLRGFAQKEA